MRESLRSVWNESHCEEKTSTTIHFHKLEHQHAADTHAHTHLNTHSGKKRKVSTEQEEELRNTQPEAKRSETPRPLSAEDLELLNSY